MKDLNSGTAMLDVFLGGNLLALNCLGYFMRVAGNDCGNCPERVQCWEIFREREKLLEANNRAKNYVWYEQPVPGLACDKCG